jgi:serine/threonine protein kinase
MADPETNEDAQPRKPPPKVPDHELIRLIGEGSYGEVWLARNSLGTFRAVKVIQCGRFKENDRPYEREFIGLKNFEPISRGHEGLVDILQVGRDDDAGYFFYVMEIADDASAECGMRNAESTALATPRSALRAPHSYKPLTLEDKIHANGRLPVVECIRIAITLADALRYLHERELVHRDIKPSNIIFVDGVPKLADVGLVARTDSARTYVGTEGFVPPEGPGTPKADIYSLGKCLYEMAMGKDRQAFPSPPTLLDELPDRKELLALNEVINKACDPDPTERYQTAQAMLDELHLLQRGESVSGARKRRKRLRLAATVGVVTASFALIAGSIWAINYQTKPRILFQDDFDAPQLDTNLWSLSHADWGEPEAGRRTFSAEQSGGELVLHATADHYEGGSTIESVWVDSNVDLRQLGPCRVEIDLSGWAREGLLGVAISARDAPVYFDVAGVKLAGMERVPERTNAWPAGIMRIDFLPHSHAAVVYPDTDRLDDFDVVDLQSAPKWHLRFHGSASTARGLPGGLMEMRIKRVVVSGLRQKDKLVGRVIEVPSLWPVEDAVIKDASGRTLGKTLANGAFAVNYEPDAGPISVEKRGYELAGGQTPGASVARAFVTAELRKSEPGFGDVVDAFSISDPAGASFGVQSIGFRGNTLNVLVNDATTAGRLVPVDTHNRIAAFDSPETLKLSFEKSIGPLGLAECGTRLIGITHFPGKILNLQTNPLQVVMELKHPDGSPLNWPAGCAFDGRWLWFVEHDRMNQRFGLHALDLDRMVITNSFKSSDPGIFGLAWDGKQFWVSLFHGGGYQVSLEALLRHRTVEMAQGRRFKGHYDALAFGDDYLWGLEVGRRRICKIKVTD